MKQPKRTGPKFFVGQVVAQKVYGSSGGQIGWRYWPVREDMLLTDGWEYQEGWDWHKESELRPLNAKEVGPGWARRKA